MSKKRKQPNQKRSSSVGFLLSDDAYRVLCSDGYTSLDKNPEVITACNKIAALVSSMTIHLMSNSDKGDQRIINELSKKVDINPNRYMTRRTWMESIVMDMLLYGKGNCVVIPMTDNGQLGDMVKTDPYNTSFVSDGYGYKVQVNGELINPDNILHFVHHPDPQYPWKGQGITVAVSEVAKNLKQAATTKNAFMSSKFQPSVIVKVDATVEELGTPEGRKQIVKEYTDGLERGEPWMLPGDMMDVKEIRPLTLSDLAINDTVTLDKKTVAGIIGVPPFVLGVGTYSVAEWDNFISGTIKPIAEEIEQELTRKILLSPSWYFKFNVQSLYAYDLKTTADVFSNLYVRGIVDGNEVRDKLSMSPREGLDGLVILENYIPLDKIGDQLKLKQGGEDNV